MLLAKAHSSIHSQIMDQEKKRIKHNTIEMHEELVAAICLLFMLEKYGWTSEFQLKKILSISFSSTI